MTSRELQRRAREGYDPTPVLRCTTVEAAKAMQSYLERGRREVRDWGLRSGESRRRNRERERRA